MIVWILTVNPTVIVIVPSYAVVVGVMVGKGLLGRDCIKGETAAAEGR